MNSHYLNFKNIYTKSYNYNLPEENIAKFPVKQRDTSKLLIYNKGKIEQNVFSALPDFFNNDDLLVFNETKVIKARIIFRKNTGAKIEVFCLEPYQPADYEQAFQTKSTCVWKCAVGNLKKWKTNLLTTKIEINGKYLTVSAEKLSKGGVETLVRFSWDNEQLNFGDITEAVGKIPIPPYLKRESEKSDVNNYQTVYSRIAGSVAAPTAGLHFTKELMQKLDDKKVKKAFVNLHVGAGTFRPVNSETADQHEMHSEHFIVDRKTIETIIQHRSSITAIGTTSVRTLESLYWFGVKAFEQKNNMSFLAQEEINSLPQSITVQDALSALIDFINKKEKNKFKASTQIFIVPGYKFKLVNKMITNFHLPKSTLLMLVSAFVGEDWRKIYDYALQNKFRFLSYGDSSLLIR